MIETHKPMPLLPPATDGTIAVNNLQSARRAAWAHFWRAPEQPGMAERILEQEQLVLQFLGDHAALDRLETLADAFAEAGVDAARAALLRAQVAAVTHRFADARTYLAQATANGAPPEAARRLALAVDQACATRLDDVLAHRRREATRASLEDLVPLGALLADLGKFDEAGAAYRQALSAYRDVSPFAPAWACFQLGVLWGELAGKPEPARAALWYEAAIDYLPAYVKARVHLAELLLQQGRHDEALGLLNPVAGSGDPEVQWRLADALTALGEFEEAEKQLQIARSGFEALLQKYTLAFADHGAAFYSGSGNDPAKALQLARINLANRPTLRAFQALAAVQ